MARKKKKLAVIDFETDPFKYGRVPKPFTCEFYSDKQTAVFWGDDCADQLFAFLDALPDEHIIYAHNGGKFDFHFLHTYLDNPALIIKSRIVKCRLGKHELRDSYAILPMPLKGYKKQEFDYAKMERPVRERHKEEILEYQHSDCVYLFELVSAFRERFGNRLTIGGTAIKELQKFHPFEKQGGRHDETFRPYYFGGRVQCFRSGILKGPWRSYDVNSMYPSVMRNRSHPSNGTFERVSSMPDDFDRPYFLRFEGRNRGALPSKLEDGGLTFDKPEGEFFACSHEIEAALEFGLIDITRVLDCHIAAEPISFGDYVDTYYAQKADCKAKGDHIGEIFAKLLLNSAYGRTGINPANFSDWLIWRDYGSEEEIEAQGYKSVAEFPDFELWAKPAQIDDRNYCDVSIAASITSAARAVLLRGLQTAVDPIYCDTDAIICRDFAGDIDPLRLGAWDLEKTADEAVICGKKLYALYNRRGRKLEKVKLSSKGGTLKLEDLIAIAKGKTVRFQNDAPTFSLRKKPSFVTRNFRLTVDPFEEAA
jgi:hypothetical protein